MQRETTRTSGWLLATAGAAGLLIAAAALASGASLGSLLAGLLGALAVVVLAAGLADLFVRRRDRELAARVTDPVQGLSTELQAARRQVDRELELLAAIAQRAEVWSEAVAGLARLEQALARGQQEGQAQSIALLRDAVHDFRAELKTSFEESARASREVFVPWVEDTTRRATEAARVPLTEMLEVVGSALARRGEEETAHWRSLEQQLAGWLADSGLRESERGEQLAELTTRLEQHLEATSELARQQLEAGAAAERERDVRGAAGIEKLSALVAAVGEAGERQREEFARESRRLAESVAAQGRDLARQFAACSDRVGEAAAGVQAGAAEVGSAAALFSEAVDRHREAATGWLASLAEVEAAVERAGQGAAAEALREQLSASQQIFARQLEFQRELFEQLRALRETDVRRVAESHEDAPATADPGSAFEATDEAQHA